MPLLSLSIFTLVGFFVLGSTNITLDTWIGASVSIISPLPLLFLGFKCFLTILTPSTITLESNILVIFPSLPLFEPEMNYELYGDVNNVVFPCGAVMVKDEIFLYYGGADLVVGVAKMKVKDILKGLV